MQRAMKQAMKQVMKNNYSTHRHGYWQANANTQLYSDYANRRDQAYYLTQKGLELFASLKNDK